MAQVREHISIYALFNLEQFEKSSQTMQRKMKASARQIKSVGEKMSLGISLPIAVAARVAVKEFAEFEQSMAKVNAVSGATAGEFKELTLLAEKLGRTTRYTASEVSGLELNYAKLGFTPDQIQKITEATLDLALATGEELADSAMVAGATLRGFGLDGEEMGRVVDVMAKSFTSSALDLEKFKVSISKIASIAGVTGRSIEEVAAHQSVLADTGVEASIIGTSLRKIYGDLAKEGMSYKEAMDAINSSTNKVATATKLFDIRAANAAIILSQQQDKVKRLTDSYREAEGEAKRMAEIMNNTLQMAFKRLQSAVEGAAIKFGEVLAPMVRKFAEIITIVAQKMARLSPVAKKIIAILSVFLMVIPPLIMLFGHLAIAITATQAANAAMLVPFAAFLAVIVGVTAALSILDTKIRQHSPYYNRTKDYVEKLTESVEDYDKILKEVNKTKLKGINASKQEIKQLGDEIVKRYGLIQTLISETIQRKQVLMLDLKGQVKLLGGQGGQMGEAMDASRLAAIEGMQAKIDILSKDIDDLGAKGTDLLKKLRELQKLKTPLPDLVEIVPDALTPSGQTTKKSKSSFVLADILGEENKIEYPSWWKQELKKFGDKVEGDLKQTFENKKTGIVVVSDYVFKYTKKQLQAMEEYIKDFGQAIEQMTEQAIYSTADMLGTMLGDDEFKGKDFGRGLLEMIAGFMQQLGALMIAFGVQYGLFEGAILSGNAPLAIVAGAALVAAGAAIKGTLSKGLDGGGSSYSGSSYGGGASGYGGTDFSNEVIIQGREMIIVQKREGSFRR